MKRIIVLLSLVLVLLFSLSTVCWADIDGRSRNITRFGENLDIGGSEVVSGNVTVFGANAVIAGTVDGDVTVLGGDAVLKSTAVVEGNLTVLGGRMRREPGAKIRGQITSGGRFFPRGGFQVNPGAWFGFSLIYNFLVLLGTLALGAVVLAILPDHTENIALFIAREPWQSVGVGILGLLVVVPAIVLLAITIIGIPLIPLLLLFVAVAYIYGYITASFLIGKRIFEVSKAGAASPIVEVLVGILVIGLLRFIPFIGGLVALVVGILGFGSVLITKFGTGRPWIKRREAATS